MNLDKCVRNIDFVNCELPATRWFAGVRAIEWEPASFGVIPLCEHCSWYYSHDRSLYKEVTRQEAEVLDVQES